MLNQPPKHFVSGSTSFDRFPADVRPGVDQPVRVHEELLAVGGALTLERRDGGGCIVPRAVTLLPEDGAAGSWRHGARHGRGGDHRPYF